MSLKLILGCMYAGKTSELYREYYVNKNIKNIICINYSEDNRYGDDEFAYTHNNNKIPCIKAMTLFEVDQDTLEDSQVIMINEGQFFDDIYEFCKYYCDEKKKHIIVAGLDGDFERKPFPTISKLISIADEYVKLKAKCVQCNDGTDAIFSKRLSDNKEKVVIGNDIYQPVCRKHYHN